MILCIPTGHYVSAYPLNTIMEWGQKAKAYLHMEISNRVDMNRSLCITLAKQRHEDLLMVDSDVHIVTDPLLVTEYLKQDTKVADVVVGLLVSELGLLVRPPPPPDDSVYLYDVDWSSLGFTYIPKKTLRRLRPISKYGFGIDMYMTYTKRESEDVYFTKRLKKKGFKVMADRRIRLQHVKKTELRLNTVHFEVEVNK